MPICSVADVAALYEREIADTDVTRVTEVIAVRERRLAELVPHLAARVAVSPDYAAAVKDVVRECVLRYLRNPEGYQGEHSGDYGYYFGGAGDARAQAAAAKVAPFTVSEVERLRARASAGAPRTLRVATTGDGGTGTVSGAPAALA